MTESIPHAPEIERAILSAMLFEPEAIEIVAENLHSGAFYTPSYSLIFDASLSLWKQGNPVDQLTVTECLKQRKALDNVGGESAIAGIANELTGAANVAYHCRIVNEKLMLRQILALTSAVRDSVLESKKSPIEIAAMIQTTLLSLMDKTNDKPYNHIKTHMQEAFDKIKQRFESEKVTGIPTGLNRVDTTLDGMQNGDLYLLAARPGEGKSALAGQIAVYAAENNFPVGIFALEMKGRDLGIRFISSKARRNLSPRACRTMKPTPEEWQRLTKACADISNLPIFIDQTSGLSISQVFAKANRMKRDFGMKLLVIDYLQLMSGEGKEASREREVSAISNGLKNLAKALDIPVLALSQLSRKATEAEYTRPRLSHLRESGSLEQDADAVLFIYNPSPEDKQKTAYYRENGMPVNQNDGVRTIIVEKDRQGEIGDIDVYWNKETVTFYNLEYERN